MSPFSSKKAMSIYHIHGFILRIADLHLYTEQKNGVYKCVSNLLVILIVLWYIVMPYTIKIDTDSPKKHWSKTKFSNALNKVKDKKSTASSSVPSENSGITIIQRQFSTGKSHFSLRRK